MKQGIPHRDYIGDPNRAERRRHSRENHKMLAKVYPKMGYEIWVCQSDNCNIEYKKVIPSEVQA